MWEYQNKKMKQLKKTYDKRSQTTQNRIQEVFNLLNIDELNVLYSIASQRFKKRVNAYIDDWRERGYLKGYFGTKADMIYRRKKVKYNEILELFIYFAFIEESFDLKDKEDEIFYDIADNYYREGQEQTGIKNPKGMSMETFIMLMETPIIGGLTWKEYKDQYIMKNSYDIYRLAIQDIQQGKKPNIDKYIFRDTIRKQLDKLVKIKDGKISGEADSAMIGNSNQSLILGMLEGDPDARVRFIAVMDDRTTKMCKSLDGQVFYIKRENEFKRYSDLYDGMETFKCFGMVLGLNLPPINDHFHWCRSTIEYVK